MCTTHCLTNWHCAAHFEALHRVVELHWKSGSLDKSEPYLKQAETACSQCAHEPGLNYCKGLFHWYSINCQCLCAFIQSLLVYRYRHNVDKALHHFNLVRKDTDWGERALFNMVEVCLSPDDELLVGGSLKTSAAGASRYTWRDGMIMKGNGENIGLKNGNWKRRRMGGGKKDLECIES